MMGINDSGYVKYYEEIPEANSKLFDSYRTYRFLKIMWMQILRKDKRAVVSKSVEGNNLKKQDKSFLSSSKLENIEQNNVTQTGNFCNKAVELGSFLREQGRFTLAEESFKKAIELNPTNDWAYIQLGYLYNDQKKSSLAEESFKKAIELNPTNDWAYIQLGYLYNDQKKSSLAEESFKKAIELNPTNDWAYLNLGSLYKNQGRLSQAEKLFQKALELDPNNDRIYGALAMVYKEMGRQDVAQEYFRKTNKIREEGYDPVTFSNYHKLKEVLDERGIKFACVQYPMRSIELLKRIFLDQNGIIFVDNDKIFKEVINKTSYNDYFVDSFAGDFGHCTEKGNRLLAKNIASNILKKVFGQ